MSKYDLPDTWRLVGGNMEDHQVYSEPDSFEKMMIELCRLNIKYLQQLLSDLKGGYIPPWAGDYHRKLRDGVEASILERTLLK